MANFKKVGALWRTKRGTGYSGRLEATIGPDDKLFLGKNKHKEEGDKKPDLVLSVIEEEEENPEPKGTMVDEDQGLPF